MPRKTAIPEPPVDVFPEGEDPATMDPTERFEQTFPTSGEVIEPQTGDSVEDVPIRAITTIPTAPTSNSVIVGLGALAAMSDEEYEAKKAIMARGLARVEDLQKTLMVDKQDYGRVPGIAKPFLQLSGAEKLANFYGYAVRQEVDRLIGDGITAPPLTFIVPSYVHLGSLDGPVIAQGFGECNSWEDKYRWRFERPLCEKCGHELMKGKPDGNMAGVWFCPGFKGGCWSKYPIESIPAPGKVENDEPYSLAETLIQMASKRSFVAAIRRATGTSGLFSQDDDSPSVQQQSSDSNPYGDGEGAAPVVESATVGIPIAPGAKTDTPTEVQFTRLFAVAKEKGVNPTKIAELLNRLFDLEVEPNGKATTAAARGLTATQVGQLIQAVETGEVPPDDDEILAAALMPDDIGAK